MWDTITNYWHYITVVFAAVDVVLVFGFIIWILWLKKEPASAIAWCLLVILLPYFGALLFVLFGYQSVSRPLRRKRQHRVRFRARAGKPSEVGDTAETTHRGYRGLAQLATRLGATWPATGNRVDFYQDGRPAFDAMFAAIRAARHHIHMQFFIFRNDSLGRQMMELLTTKAKEGVEVRLLVDGFGAHNVGWRFTRDLSNAGGKVATFLPVSLWRRRLQINLRNHRKTVVVDGHTAFTGGLNVGVEYLGQHSRLSPWRDTFLKLSGPAVEGLQSHFIEDWDFATDESLQSAEYYPLIEACGDVTVQVIASGPDLETRPIREVLFAAFSKARKRLWVTTPYYVPDQGIRDSLCLAALSGVDVRLLIPKNPDHWMPHFACRYYLPDLLNAGVKVYWYQKGFIHSKVITIDGMWASVGTANLDNRSLMLNFEVNCLFHTPSTVHELEQQFLVDLEDSLRIDARQYAKRSWPGRWAENVCRLFTPVL